MTEASTEHKVFEECFGRRFADLERFFRPVDKADIKRYWTDTVKTYYVSRGLPIEHLEVLPDLAVIVAPSSDSDVIFEDALQQWRQSTLKMMRSEIDKMNTICGTHIHLSVMS